MKKTIFALLSLVLLLGCLVFPAAATDGSEQTDPPLRVLTIGNSYTKDSMPLINKIAMAHGEEPMVLGWLYYPGCTLSLHYSYGSGDKPKYDYFKNETGTSVKTADTTLLHALQDDDWDIIFLQQAPCESAMPETFDTHLDNLINYVNTNKTNPDATFGWHMTWAYQKAYQAVGSGWQQGLGKPTYASTFASRFGGDPYTMYQEIAKTTQEKVMSRKLAGTEEPEFVLVTPSGTAIENARSSYFGDNLQRDCYHLNQIGRIITAYTWYATLTGKDQLDSIMLSDADAEMTLSEDDRKVILESVNNALAKPYERTQSTNTERPDEKVYFVLPKPDAAGGTVEAYDQADPTKKVNVTYDSMVNVVSNNTFYKLEDGVLTGLRLYNAPVAIVGYHNFFKSYDAETQTLHLTDDFNATTIKKTCDCDFNCYYRPNGDPPRMELPLTIYNVPIDTPVVDVTGTEHNIKTLEDVINLSARYGVDIKLNHYSPDASAPDAFYVNYMTEPTYNVTVGTVENGTVSVNPVSGIAGDTVTVTAIADYGYELENILVDGVAIPDGGNTFTITKEHVVTATFTALTTYPVSAEAIGHGTVTVNRDKYVYGDTAIVTVIPEGGCTLLDTQPLDEDTTPVISATAESDYELSQLLVDGVDVTTEVENGRYTFTVSGNHEITATFVPKGTQEPEVKFGFSGANLVLQDNLAVTYKVPKSLFETEGYTDPYVVFEFNGTQTVVDDYTVIGDKYAFMFLDIAPHKMNDTIYATLHATYEGQDVASQTREYSVATYCYSMLSEYSADTYAEFRTLLVDLLNYGAESQKYMSYKTDALVNAELTETQKGWGTSEMRELVSVMNKQYEIAETPDVLWKGATLILGDSITMRFKVQSEDLSGFELKIHSQSSRTWTLTPEEFEAISTEDNMYYVYFNGLKAGEMSEPIYLTFYNGDTKVSDTVCYSVESYASEMQNDASVGALVKAMMCYGDSAKEYAN